MNHLNLDKIEAQEQRRAFKKSIFWAAISAVALIFHLLALPKPAQAQTQALTKGACVMGSNKVVNNRLQFVHPIKVYNDATDREPRETMVHHDTYYIDSQVPVSGRVRLVYAAGFDGHPQAGKVFGWVDRADLVAYDRRNCD